MTLHTKMIASITTRYMIPALKVRENETYGGVFFEHISLAWI